MFLAVGDVVGRGTVAASVMGQLRSAMRAYALAGFRPRAVLEHLSRFAAGIPGAEVSTAACVEIDPRSDRVTYACAGHPHPVVVDGDGGVRILRDGRGPALGVTDRGYTEAQAEIPPGASLLLFTDGLVERRAEPLEVGLERLGAAAAAERAEPAGVMADRVVAHLAGAVSSDDVALLVARRDLPPPPLKLVLAATPDNLAVARAAVRDWLAAAHVGADGVQDVVLATGEALANAVEHGSADDGSQRMRLEMRLGPGREIGVVVADEGGWRPPAADPGLRGQGIRIMRAVMDEVEIDRGDAGTTIRMVRHPRVPPRPRAVTRRAPRARRPSRSTSRDPQRPIAVVTGTSTPRAPPRWVTASGANAPRTAPAARPGGGRLPRQLGRPPAGGARRPPGPRRRDADGAGAHRGPVHRVLVLTGLEDAAGLRLEEG